MKIVRDSEYRFTASFNTETGFYFRTGILDACGKDTGEDPFMASFPHLLDIGIMGHCVHGSSGFCLKSGVQCYQDGLHRYEENMPFADFERIASECEGRVFQFALGGRGDPEMHEDFERILESCRRHDIVPNITTSGFGLTPAKAKLIKKYCGAAAVSWYRSPYTLRAIDMLLAEGVTTNIHYVISNSSIDEAAALLEESGFPADIKKIVFLLHKPVGLGSRENVLGIRDRRVRRFFKLFDRPEICRISGFDSCCIPGILNMTANIHTASLDTCEAARFSAYVTPAMRMLPCSFDQDERWGVDLRISNIEEAWNSAAFESFRDHLRNSCRGCSLHKWCLGGCPIDRSIVLCGTVNGGVPSEIQN